MKKFILTCNPGIVNQLLLNKTLPREYLSDNWESILTNYQNSFNSVKFFYDRTGTIPHFLNIDSGRYPMPDTTNFSLSFEEVVEKRAKELLSIGKPINVSWSGGLDSTFTLFSLAKYANDPSQIKVYCTYNSIIESGDLFDLHIKDRFKYIVRTNTSVEKNYEIDDSIYVTGGMGNDLFSPGTKFGDRDTWMKFKDPGIEFKYLLDKPYESVLQESNLIFLEDFIKKSPRKIETLEDLRWWVSFSFNWYNCATNFYIGIGPEKSKRIHAFFESDDFQRWAMTNNDPVTKTGDYSDERWQLRESITEYTGCSKYSLNKTKSTSVLSQFGTEWLFLLNDYSNVYLQDL